MPRETYLHTGAAQNGDVHSSVVWLLHCFPLSALFALTTGSEYTGRKLSACVSFQKLMH
jgi:hypothetical protein